MTLNEILSIVDTLSLEDKQKLRVHLEEQEHHQLIEQKISRLKQGFAMLREGLDEAELAAISQAMNEEYIEPFDETEWRE